ncbi:MAG: hypothetical protein ABI114_11185 [Rhodanobacter sp.]
MWPALSGGFIFDDYGIFAENPVVHVTGWHWEQWQNLWQWSEINIQRPLAMFSYALNYAFGAGTWGFKATNLCIHLLNTVLLLSLVQRLLFAGWLPRANDNDAQHHQRTWLWALAIATAWAIHPLQVSTVMYVVQRMEMLGLTFTMLALLAYWRGRQSQITGRKGWPWLLLCVALTAIGYLAKETAVLVAGYALLLELTVLRFTASRPAISRLWKFFYSAGCVAAVLIFVFYLLPHYATAANYVGRDYTAWQRELTQLRALSMYIGWIVLPLSNHMHFYYDNYVVSTGWLHPVSTLFGGLFLLGLLALAVALRRRRPLFALGIGWFFMAHALTSSPLPLELVFEHRNYPALFGILLAAADLIWLGCRRAHPRLPAVLAVVFILNLGFLTVLRASTWGNQLQLSMTLTQDNPGSPRASLDLARRLMARSQGDTSSPLYSLSVTELERGAALPGASILAEEALILTSAAQHTPAPQAWWDALLRKVSTQPLGPETYQALHKLDEQLVVYSKDIDAQQLANAYTIVIKRNPARASLYVQYAEIASVALHNPGLASEQWEHAVSLNKDPADYGKRLATFLLDNHRYQEAAAVMSKAAQLRPALRNDAEFQSQQALLDQATARDRGVSR